MPRSLRLVFASVLPLACAGSPAGTEATGDAGSETGAATTGGATSTAATTAVTTDAPTTSTPTTGEPADGLHPIPGEPQRDGDPEAGYHALVNNGYVTCGIPWTAYSQVFDDAPEVLRLPGRDGKNATLPYDKTAFVGASGVELVSANCLQCHAGEIDGKLVVGLGNTTGDFTVKVGGTAALADLFLTEADEKAELQRFVDRLAAVEPYTQMLTVGVNPADNIAAVLFSHRDPDTFEWFDPPLLDLPPVVVTPVDVPPWWHMKKKHAMFYVAAGRGDHARTMMAAATLCTDDIDEARAIDAYFPDIRAYILTIEPPAYPFAIDAELAAAGADVFAATCAGCHGTYGTEDTYPNLLVDLDVIGTDAALATDASQFAGRYLDWFNHGFYGEVSRLEPQNGYVAPPLDGIWATAPYLHNGSVPTVAAMLDSTSRPTYWTRSYESTDYDSANLGWNHEALDHGHEGEPSAEVRKTIYDTTQPGYGNGGHTFGDALSASERLAVLEYLKTL
ncbi:c-type cytochrome [Nannocystis sp. SCPEA4]|uniref:c-type cytochrome n=1 Tax=Nannocystis sp. SCPEA4 TaxID=2996787 RepID=UPI0022713EA1|nr:c-type cytochrome [Nannocystis sp. SCPEA4]MCY1053987.1 c-type cytochrome [Nannocystis sp. SCPEA4]